MTDVLINIIIVLVIASLSILVIYLANKARQEKLDKMSFKEAMDLCNLPVVTFVNNGKKLNFILDTGAETSVINKSTLEALEYTKTNKTIELYGIEGNTQTVNIINISIDYKCKSYIEEFQVVNLTPIFDKIKSQHGVTLHGILSSAFFKKYRYILDFNELIAYSKL